MSNDADTIREMLAAWSRLESEVRARYPRATADQIYRLVSGAMTKAVGL